MNNIDIRKSIVQAKFNEDSGKTLEGEILGGYLVQFFWA